MTPGKTSVASRKSVLAENKHAWSSAIADMTQWKENLSENPTGPTSPAMKTTDGSGGSALADAHVVEGTETICVHQLEPSTR